ncbi:hypothetical protein CJF42_15765 [Pseudoalteromonas sp. NBT06-2]|uniref:hypothetical protein n=1 Tax=Pseudoalteromonas sp. NBT06-2 TaxID=2025950 RepID=UPI000BA567C2|nr:hypothetical protein [Pseudoalteromonas sp. NBT06-2]PAJ73440.1 hypothetical protein CJF42_15765 [Pseudoalteromonas sp. NBT06-2]
MSEQLKLQSDLLAKGKNHLAYIELCNAFYAREVIRLSRESDQSKLRRLLASLPYYIERVSVHILQGNSPLQLDGQNGCWIAKQSIKFPSLDKEKNRRFYTQKSFPGFILPLAVLNEGELVIKIDCLDQVYKDKIHCNEHGWFDFSGQALDKQTAYIMKPTKLVMTAACCGHRWHQGKRAMPRLLSLREMLLAARINWHNFNKPLT